MAGTTTQRLTERVAAPFAEVRVDREKGVVYGVLLCGTESDNGRSYPWGRGLTHRLGTYEGRPSNCGHGVERPEDRRIGWFENEHTDPQGRPRADFHVLKSHPMAERVMENAERKGRAYGLSHVATCKTRTERGRVVVEDVVSVETVDVVADPATTRGFHEHRTGATVTTIKKLLESLAPRLDVGGLIRLRRLSEMDGMGELPVDPPPADAAPEDGVSAAFKAAIMSVVDSAMSGATEPKEALSKIKKLLLSHGDVNGDGKVDDADVDAAGTAEESKLKGKAADGTQLVEALAVCDKVGFRPDRTDLETVAATAPDRREAVAKRLKESSGSGGKPTGPFTTARGGGTTQTAQAVESRQGQAADTSHLLD
jgi:hypothetical protein